MTQENIDYSVIQSKQVAEMLTVANEFCLFMEEIERFDKTYIAEYLQRVLPLLYIKGSLIPMTEPNDEIDNERYVIEETWEYFYNLIMNLFGNKNTFYYWNPDLNESAQTSVSEVLADLYQDMKDFVMLFSKPSHYARMNSVHMCRDLFIRRWGKSIPLLLNYLHDMVYENEINIDDNELL